MRTLLAALLVFPALSLAQAPLERPTDGPQPGPPPRRTRPAIEKTADEGSRPPPPRPTSPVGRGPPAPAPAASAPVAGPQAQGAGPIAPAPPAGPGAAPGEATIRPSDGRCVPLQGRFMLSFNKADIIDVLEQASRWTCRNFIYTDDVARGKITLLSKTSVTADEAYAAFLAALAANNITIYATGKYYKLGRMPDSKKLPIPTMTGADSEAPATEQIMTKVIRLQSTDADLLRGVLGNFISPQGADIQSIPPDTLIVTDTGLNIRRIEKMLETIDRPGGGDVIRVVQLRYATAKDVADKLNQIFQTQGANRSRRVYTLARPVPSPVTTPAAGPGAQPGTAPPPGSATDVSVSKVIPDDRTNKLIIIADEKSFQRVEELIEQLDVPTGGDGGVHVVFLKNATAEDLATTLSNLAQGQAKKAGATPPAQAPVIRTGGMVVRPPNAAPAPPGTEGATAELFSGEVKVTADKAQNALLIQASGSDYIAISRLIEKLDRPRRQVFVEGAILEVDIDNGLDIGVGAHAFIDVTVNGKQGVLPIVSQPGQVSSLSPASIVSLGGFLTGFSGPTSGVLQSLAGVNLPSLGLLIRALESSSDVNVISTPHVLATDNEDSEITVGQNVPFQTGYFPPGLTSALNTSTTSGTATALGTTIGTTGVAGLAAGIERQDVELKLKMKPQINEGGNVRLTVEVQNEEISSTDPVLGPTTAKRTVKTQVITKDQSTIVIGGLIQDRVLHSVKKVPLLGSLPLLGGLFRETANTKQKTNLLIFLTPYIIRDADDYRHIYEKKKKEFDDFMVQYYGERSAFNVQVDYSKKPGPLALIHHGVVEESLRLENGGAGLPGEGMTSPPGGPEKASPTPSVRPAAQPSPQPEHEPELSPPAQPGEPPGNTPDPMEGAP
ncbi:MAG TPA: type II secretion system secretin GspD [Anaeromyxobacter sp.]|nr:type II secretion system secretin GspD [Anaeromyxobacter sp.]